jgi:hypothetical protein
MLGLLFYPEDGGSKDHRNVGIYLLHYTNTIPENKIRTVPSIPIFHQRISAKLHRVTLCIQNQIEAGIAQSV